jgi:hypothetical protein
MKFKKTTECSTVKYYNRILLRYMSLGSISNNSYLYIKTVMLVKMNKLQHRYLSIRPVGKGH